MARPVKKRNICALPETAAFAPADGASGDDVLLGVDEFETLRLIDYLELTQDACAAQMHVARTTVQAMYNAARRKLATAMVEGRRLVITGGSYSLCPRAASCRCRDCDRRGCAGCGGNCGCGCR